MLSSVLAIDVDSYTTTEMSVIDPHVRVLSITNATFHVAIQMAIQMLC